MTHENGHLGGRFLFAMRNAKELTDADSDIPTIEDSNKRVVKFRKKISVD